MSFDLLLQRFRDGEAAPADKGAVRAVLQPCRCEADAFGFYAITFVDGSSTELSARRLASGEPFDSCVFHMRSFSKPEIELIHAVAVAGDMVAFNMQGEDEPHNPSVILFSESQRAHLPAGIARSPVAVASASQLGQALGGSTQRWENYRDQVVRSGRKER